MMKNYIEDFNKAKEYLSAHDLGNLKMVIKVSAISGESEVEYWISFRNGQMYKTTDDYIQQCIKQTESFIEDNPDEFPEGYFMNLEDVITVPSLQKSFKS